MVLAQGRDGINSLVPDAGNRVASSSGTLGSGTYTFSASNHPIVKASAGNTTVYSCAGNPLIVEYVNGVLSKEYIHPGRTVLAEHDSGTRYFHRRDRSPIRVTTDANGNKLGEQGHFLYGESW